MPGEILRTDDRTTYPHFLNKPQKTEMPRFLIAVDTEAHIEETADGEIHTLRLGHAVEVNYARGKWTENHHAFRTLDEFYAILDKHIKDKQKVRVVAHNMAYDYGILALDDYISSRKLTIQAFVLQPFIIKARNQNKGTLEIISSTNWFKLSLKETGKAFGIEKDEVPNFKNVSDDVLASYCKQDALVLARIMEGYIDFLRSNDLGNFALTIAGQALSAFTHKYMDEKTILLHRYKEVTNMELASYKGGRCEVFQMGKLSNVFKLDVNSMYPFVMSEHSYPVKTISKKPVKLSLDSINDIVHDESRFVIANVKLRMKEPAIAVRRDKLIFPVGDINECLCGPELKYILDNPEFGTITSVTKACVYTAQPVFKGYVDFFYAIKKAKESPASVLMAKLFLNSLYGKWGQREHEDIEVAGPELQYMVESMRALGINSMFGKVGGTKQNFILVGADLYSLPKADKDALARNSFPALASAVTAHARVYLDTLISCAGRDNVFYTDTDSLFTNEAGYSALLKSGFIHDSRLGALKLEAVGDTEIKGPKNYIFTNYGFDSIFDVSQMKLKGVKKNAIEISPGVYEQMQFRTKKTRYSRGDKPGTIHLERVEKSIKGDYTKGIIDDNGRVSPLTLSEI
jgi:hypothetical protein